MWKMLSRKIAIYIFQLSKFMGETLSNLVESYGYVAVFVLIALECLGIPLPGESVLVSAAAFAASGRLSLPWLLFVAAAAAIVGDNGGYWIGRSGYWIGRKAGFPIIKRYGDVLHIDESKIESACKFFERQAAGRLAFVLISKILSSGVCRYGHRYRQCSGLALREMGTFIREAMPSVCRKANASPPGAGINT